jgi:hypothetical protein
LLAYFERWPHGDIHVVLVVPDHVARVAYLLAGRAPIYATVHSNVTAVEIDPMPSSPIEAAIGRGAWCHRRYQLMLHITPITWPVDRTAVIRRTYFTVR